MPHDTIARGLAVRAAGGIRNVFANGNDVTLEVQTALDLVGSQGHVRIIGDGFLSDTLVVRHDGQTLDGLGTLGVRSMRAKPMVQVLNCSRFRVGEGLLFDPAWADGVTAIEVAGGILGEVRLDAQRCFYGVTFDCRTDAATQGSSLCEGWITIRSGVHGLVFAGGNGKHASNNRIHVFNWWGAEGIPSIGIDYVAWCDNNTVHGYLNLNSAASAGLTYNTQDPSSDLHVYENHWDGIVDASVTGTTALLGNRTHGSLGQFPSFVRLRIGGGKGAAVRISEDSDIVFVQSNFDGRIRGWPGDTVVAVNAGQMLAGFGAEFGQIYDQRFVILTRGSDEQYGWSQVALPPDWRAFDMVVDWTLNSSSGGTVTIEAKLNQLVPGAAPEGGDSYRVVAAASDKYALVSTQVAKNVPRMADIGAFRVARASSSDSDTGHGDLCIYAVRFVRQA